MSNIANVNSETQPETQFEKIDWADLIDDEEYHHIESDRSFESVDGKLIKGKGNKTRKPYVAGARNSSKTGENQSKSSVAKVAKPKVAKVAGARNSPKIDANQSESPVAGARNSPKIDANQSESPVAKVEKPKVAKSTEVIKGVSTLLMDGRDLQAKVVKGRSVVGGVLIGEYEGRPFAVAPSGKKITISDCVLVLDIAGGVALVDSQSKGVYIKIEESVIITPATFKNVMTFPTYKVCKDLIGIISPLFEKNVDETVAYRAVEYETVAKSIFEAIRRLILDNKSFNTILFSKTDSGFAYAELLPNGCVACYLVADGDFAVSYQTKIKSFNNGKKVTNWGYFTEKFTKISILKDGSLFDVAIHSDHTQYAAFRLDPKNVKTGMPRYVGSTFNISSAVLAKSNGIAIESLVLGDNPTVVYFKDLAHPKDLNELANHANSEQRVDVEPILQRGGCARGRGGKPANSGGEFAKRDGPSGYKGKNFNPNHNKRGRGGKGKNVEPK